MLAIAAALAAAGCASAATSTARGGAPAVTLAQAGQVFDSYVVTSDKAARTGDAALARSNVTGMQWAQVNAAYMAYSSDHLRPPYTRYTYQKPTLYLPEPAGYPRWFAASVTRTANTTARTTITEAPVATGARAALTGRVVMVFEQASATAPWQLASTSTLPAGVSLPGVAANADGQAHVLGTSQDSGLLVRPDVVGPLLAAVVDDGPSSPAASVVASDQVTTSVSRAARSGMGLTTPRGDVHQWALEGSNWDTFAMRTTDGGALVFFAMYLNVAIEVPSNLNQSALVRPGRPIRIPGELMPMLPAGTKAPRVSLERQDLLSFVAIDPPAANGDGKIQVIALGDALNYASAS